MTTFSLTIIGIILSGILLGIFAGIISKKQNQNIPQSFVDYNYINSKFTDQTEISIDEVIKNDFKLLNI